MTSFDYPDTDYANISYPKANPKPKRPNPKASIASFPAGTWRQAPFILPTMSSKPKYVVLSFTIKLKIAYHLKNAASGSSLARKYGVGNAKISNVKKNSDAIINYDSALDNEDGSLYRKVMKMAENKDLDVAVYTWFMQLRSQRQPISGLFICEKALEINYKIGVNPDFEATTGSLMRFKSRHGIRQLDIKSEKSCQLLLKQLNILKSLLNILLIRRATIKAMYMS
ncbi:hypothetical protein LAZ67_8000912 [Cordylochernes scorpioides]|uniref:HTH CENPB-type domain-containing protein n=1 Tax=Cordylochernes scorpioides TaxID=51811 RepID=A0ABY6KTE5_9ARAC|nr:hypothetical protein LAZ67_8000912 [Cordylochernes scorpioides]